MKQRFKFGACLSLFLMILLNIIYYTSVIFLNQPFLLQWIPLFFAITAILGSIAILLSLSIHKFTYAYIAVGLFIVSLVEYVVVIGRFFGT